MSMYIYIYSLVLFIDDMADGFSLHYTNVLILRNFGGPLAVPGGAKPDY
jgi:hypothetical protein